MKCRLFSKGFFRCYSRVGDNIDGSAIPPTLSATYYCWTGNSTVSFCFCCVQSFSLCICVRVVLMFSNIKFVSRQVGLAINYTLMTPIYLQWVVRFWSELEMYFNALQRVLHYSQLRQESQPSQRVNMQNISLSACNIIHMYDASKQQLPTPAEDRAEWPTEGYIELKEVSIAYRPCLQPVVTGVNLKVSHGEKIGICGRTGSGKSTLVNAIFRLADVVSGTILIDNIDISTMEPHYLRSRLTTVPQDTLIIAGTLR